MAFDMELHICNLYPNLLNMYGDIGNVKILKYRAEKRGIKVFVHDHLAGDTFESEKYDIVMLGGGQDFEIGIVFGDMQGEKTARIKQYIEDGGVFLAIDSGFQILGASYVSAEGAEVSGLGILPFKTEKSAERFVGNIAIDIDGNRIVGFENHGGKTYLGDLNPLGRVLCGKGNNGEDGMEGLVYKNTYCTYLHGPFLSKNPEIADRLLLKALQRKYEIVELAAIDDVFEQNAKAAVLAGMGM